MLCSKAMVSGLATEPVGIFLLPKTASREQKPKVANPAPEPLAKGRRYPILFTASYGSRNVAIK
jgi:hypothetical protein